MHTILSLVAAGMGVAFAPEGRVRCGWTVWDGATDGNTGRPHRDLAIVWKPRGARRALVAFLQTVRSLRRS
ncbi:hypothetical protein GOL30_25330 [Sinorhizobium medicae]|nr:hypothetical protein [Sinorhizobium medicae]MDX0583694.1 hypothetical protein [Sinorhizobium medicae]MDX0991981.1 hypothetical protein [Sinorhizobium medicae]MDX1078019.1 hypothetical protein [Sinorhizobium medicae]